MKKLKIKKPDIAKSFKNKKSKYGGFSALMTAVVIAILLVVNLIASSLDVDIDMTKNKLYSLSDETYDIIDALDKDIKIYAFFETGDEDPTISSILDKYASRSDKITVEYKDPIKYPEYAKKYSTNSDTVEEGSLVVESGSKFKVISYYDMVNMSYNYSGNIQYDSLSAEQAVTNAIIYVTQDKDSVVYTLQGHGEAELPSAITKQLEILNYTVKDINLLTDETTLKKGDTLFVLSPTQDMTEEETNKVREFMSNGGRAIFIMGITRNSLPNFEGLLNSYGIGLNKAVIIEGNPQYRASQLPTFLFPELKSHDILSPLISNNLPVMMPGAQGIETLEIKKSSITVEPLLVTSSNSWGKTNLDATTLEKETGDLTGPFDLAVAITDRYDGIDLTKDAKLVVMGSSALVSSQYASTGGNTDFIVNCVNWLQDETDSISVLPKSLRSGTLQINALQALSYSGIVVILIPLIVVVLGVRVWLRRRHQ